MAKSTLEHRRKIRALEAKRDALLQAGHKQKTDIARVRAELTALRRQGGK